MSRMLTGLVGALLACAVAATARAAPVHTDYAVLFSGGWDASNNHARYYDQTLRMWNLLTGTLGFNATNIYVLFADGTDTGKDQCTSYGADDKCNGWKDSDWSALQVANTSILSATAVNLENTLGFLSNAMTRDDSFYFWSFDHGDTANNPSDPMDVTLTAWNYESIADDAFASWVEPLDVQAEIFAFAQCYSGGMVDDLNLAANPNRFAGWAASGCEPSWGDGWARAWADGIQSGRRWSHDLGRYAVDHDPFAPGGATCQATGRCEHPGWAGANIHIVTNEIPEPASASIAALGLLAMAWLRRGARASGRRPSTGTPPPRSS